MIGVFLRGTRDSILAIVSQRRLSRAHRIALDSTAAGAAGSSPDSTTAKEDQP